VDDAVITVPLSSLRTAFGDRVRVDEPLGRHTSFRIGGPADIWLEVATPAEVQRVLEIGAEADMPVFVLGGGTNLLVSDRGVRGIVIKLGRSFAVMEWRSNGRGAYLRAGAAVPFKRLATEAATRSLTGLEFAEGIPGSLGGGLLMNAGAFGGEIKDVIEAVEGVSAATGVQHLPRALLRFGYRRFDLPRGFVVTFLDFHLDSGNPEQIRVKMLEYKRKRDAHQPLGHPNVGSIFRNPPGHYAGRLIEEVGLKGLRIGGAMVSPKHANFIVNVGGATAADVRALMDEVRLRVWERKRVRLEPEVKLVGDWGENR
jgi:UDP-N-acetylmuramate dehydrogenase